MPQGCSLYLQSDRGGRDSLPPTRRQDHPRCDPTFRSQTLAMLAGNLSRFVDQQLSVNNLFQTFRHLYKHQKLGKDQLPKWPQFFVPSWGENLGMAFAFPCPSYPGLRRSPMRCKSITRGVYESTGKKRRQAEELFQILRDGNGQSPGREARADCSGPDEAKPENVRALTEAMGDGGETTSSRKGTRR